MKAIHAIPFAVLMLFSLAGCKVGYFHTQTTWNEDGSVERAILQPNARQGEGAFKEWDMYFRVKERNFEFRGDLRKLSPELNGEYFLAKSSSKSWKEIPDHYSKEASDSDATSTFARTATRTDYGLLIEYSWQEVLTEVVKLGDARAAIVVATEPGGNAAARIVGEALGDDYDTSKLETWVATEGREWLLELFDGVFELALEKDVSEEKVRESFARICRKHGLKVTLKTELEKEDSAEFIRFLTQLFTQTIRKANGEKVDAKTAETLAGVIGGLNEPRHERLKSRLEEAGENFKQAWPGGPEALEAKTNRLATRIFGVHGSIFDSPESFRFQMDVPGEIVETNGQIHSNGRVQWQFSGSDAWPSGFAMTVRSLDVQKSGVSLLAGAEFKPTRQNLVRIVEIIGDDEALRKVLQSCRDESSVVPLKTFLTELPMENASRKRVFELLRFLKSTLKLGE
ncbi:MAG: hypothetical protein O2820_14710 [Planctomycetota bacterium]|nr:hypothetical protein [Planctomycetota bacterium]MDA1250466.1 hypothetical protein [Planctomycetota bacterium]